MDEWIQQFAKDLGAQVVTEFPQGTTGPIGAAQEAAFFSRRMEELRRQEIATLSGPDSFSIPTDETTYHALQTAAEMLWPNEKTDAANFGGRLLKGLAVLILDRLSQRLDEKKQAIRKTIDAKDAIGAAMKDLLDGTPKHAVAG